jgi:hypothetical protein
MRGDKFKSYYNPITNIVVSTKKGKGIIGNDDDEPKPRRPIPTTPEDQHETLLWRLPLGPWRHVPGQGHRKGFPPAHTHLFSSPLQSSFPE